MHTHPRSLLVAGTLLTLALLVTGCGGSSGSDGKKSGSSSTGTSAKKVQPGGGDFCKVLKDDLKGLSAVFPKDFENAAQLKTYGAYVKQTNGDLRRAAPGELRDAVSTSTRISDQLADSYIKGGRPSADAAKQLRSPEFQAASKKVAAYAKDHCGISPSFGS